MNLSKTLLCAVSLVSASVATADKLDDHIRTVMSRSHTPGLVFGVFKDGKMLRSGAYGYANLELNVRAKTSNVFEIGSVSKMFTSTLILKLREEGKVNLQDRADQFIPDLPAEWQGVTVAQLMNHTSGIPDMEEIFGYDSYRNLYTPKQVIEIANSRPMDFNPGQRWRYSNTGYYLLGLIIEKIEAKPFHKSLETRILKPLGMSETRISNPTDVIPNRASGYMWADGRLQNRDAMQPSACLGAGTMVSTIRDMAIWDSAITHHRILSKASQDLMWQATETSSGTADYGFGWFIDSWRHHRTLSHSGGTAGFSCQYRRYRDLGISVMVFTNLYANNALGVEIRIADAVHPGISYHSAKPIPDDGPSTKAILAAMKDVSEGKKTSSGVAPEMMTRYNAQSAQTWKERLSTLKSFQLIEQSKNPPADPGTGVSTVETRVYRLESKRGTEIILFKLTADWKVGFQQSIERD